MLLIVFFVLTIILFLCLLKLPEHYKTSGGILVIVTFISTLVTLILLVGFTITKIFKGETLKQRYITKVSAYQHLADTSTPGVVAVLTPDFLDLNNKILNNQEKLHSVFGWYFVPDWWDDIPLVEF